jgi:hypothetical protein
LLWLTAEAYAGALLANQGVNPSAALLWLTAEAYAGALLANQGVNASAAFLFRLQISPAHRSIIRT